MSFSLAYLFRSQKEKRGELDGRGRKGRRYAEATSKSRVIAVLANMCKKALRRELSGILILVIIDSTFGLIGILGSWPVILFVQSKRVEEGGRKR